jgi:energy-coupling factor transport system substrate-specific component
MKEVFSMWKSTKMIVLVALTAAIYAAILIPFKAIPLIPGFTEVRPANLIPVAFGLFFGPAGAWGAAIGNTIGDLLGGSITWGTAFGFIGNFFFAYVPYKLWDNLGILKKDDMAPDCKSGKKIALFVIVNLVASCACGLWIAWGVDLLGFVPFAALGTIIPINNFVAVLILGLPVTILLYPRIKKWDLYWKDVMAEEDLPRGGAIAKTGAYLLLIASLAGLAVALFFAISSGQQAFQFAAGQAENFMVLITGGISCLLILIASFMQR